MIRILSDLHWGHKASRVKDLDVLENLVCGTETVIFNGDTVEQKFEDSPNHKKQPLPQIGQLREKVENWDSNAIFLTGNHDPRVSKGHYCEIDHGRILVTHGDAIFDAIAPWSVNAEVLRDLVMQGLRETNADKLTSFYNYLQVFKEASSKEHALLKNYDPSVWGKVEIFLRQAWPPNRPFRIVESWKRAPRKAVDLVNRFGKSPRFLVIGHTHKPDISTIGETTVINTGAFLPWPGATAVDIDNRGITVRKIRSQKGKFHLGGIVGKFEKEIDTLSLSVPTGQNKPISFRTETPFSA